MMPSTKTVGTGSISIFLLQLESICCTQAWDQSDAFPQLTELDLSRNNFNGSLPADWGADVGSFPNLTAL